MASFAMRERQRIIDEYLNASGANSFVPAEFLDWLKARPDHSVYPVFFGLSDESAARAHRLDMVRRWVSGLRVTVKVSQRTVNVGEITAREFVLPAMISPLGARKTGGGYQPVDESTLPEIRRQAAASLSAWLERFGGAAEMSGISTAPIKEIIAALEASDDVDAAA